MHWNERDSINSGSGRYLPLLVILFIGSGCAALIYEVIWLQMLQLVIGLSALSLGVLLGTFMGGMCIGSLLFPRFISLKRHPLKVYAFLELGIGLSGLLLLIGMPLIDNIYTGIAGYGLFRSVLLRSLIAAIFLLPPTILMGATLPAISRWVESDPRGVSWMGFFYGGNIFGAVAGCLIAGFYLLRVFDSAIATYVAFSVNMVVALSAFLISGIKSFTYHQPVKEINDSVSLKMKVVYIAIGLSGMAALGSEVIWTRLLSIMLGSTVYTFSIILAAFLIGLGIVSVAGAYIGREAKNPGIALGICQLLLIITVSWGSYLISQEIPYWSIKPTSGSKAILVFLYDLAYSSLAVLPPAIFWGASFPLALAAVASINQDPGRLVGRVYAANTVGAITGSLAFSIIGIPVLGTCISQKLLVAISALAASLMLSYSLSVNRSGGAFSVKKMKSHPGIHIAGVLAGILIITALVTGNIKPVPWGTVAYGRNGSSYNTRIPADTSRLRSDGSIYPLFVGEGLNGSVAVTQFSPGIRQFHSIGKVQASTDPLDMRLQRMLGHLTGLLTDNPESVLIVGCGAGITAGTFVTYPEIKKIIICDIESLVPKCVTPFFSKENYGIADWYMKKNPNVVNGKEVLIENEDGRHFIRTSNEKFDIISSDPIDPWAKGAAALYTLEYFSACKAHLKPGGAVSLWIPLYQSSVESAKSMISTFFKAFPNGIIWSNDDFGQGYDVVLFAKNDPAHIDVDALDKKFNSEGYEMVRQSLADVRFFHIKDLLSTYVGCAQDLKEWMADAQINTDRNMRLSYLSGMSVSYSQATDILYGISKYYTFPGSLFSGSLHMLDSLNTSIKKRMERIEEAQFNPPLFP